MGELGNRPIHLAAASGHTAVVKLLLRQGANVVCLHSLFAVIVHAFASMCAVTYCISCSI